MHVAAAKRRLLQCIDALMHNAYMSAALACVLGFKIMTI